MDPSTQPHIQESDIVKYFFDKKRVVLPLRYFMSECDWTFLVWFNEFKENYFVESSGLCVCVCVCDVHACAHTQNQQTCRKASEFTFLHKWGQNDMLAGWFDTGRANSLKLPVTELCVGFVVTEWGSVECWWKDTDGKTEVLTYLLTYLITYIHTYIHMYLTPCSCVLLEKLTGSNLAKKFPEF